jgi:hypothetical protein
MVMQSGTDFEPPGRGPADDRKSGTLSAKTLEFLDRSLSVARHT